MWVTDYQGGLNLVVKAEPGENSAGDPGIQLYVIDTEDVHWRLNISYYLVFKTFKERDDFIEEMREGKHLTVPKHLIF